MDGNQFLLNEDACVLMQDSQSDTQLTTIPRDCSSAASYKTTRQHVKNEPEIFGCGLR